MPRIKIYFLVLLAGLVSLFFYAELENFEVELLLLATPAPIFLTPSADLTELQPQSVNIPVPFTSQAPHEIWDGLHQEACEEAAVLQAASYWLGVESLSADQAEQELQALVALELANFGFFEDTDTLQTAQLISDYYDFSKIDVYFDISLDQIKTELATGYPVIVPTAGQQLNNPYFRNPGPIYHMLVIRGYNQDQFITNDNGTKRGEGYLYDQNVLFAAIHDWNNGEIESGAKTMIVIRP